MLQKHTKKMILLIILLCFYFADDTEAIFWNRRRRNCSASNCQMSSWSSWSTCHASCGSLSSQHRTRYVRVHASCGGGCPYSSTETRTCYGNSPVNCMISSWSSWSSCSATRCGVQGFQRRTRSITRSPGCGGAACPNNMQETKSCYGTDAVDCVYSSWSQWSTCLALHCEEHQARRRHIIRREQCGGNPCNMAALVNTRLCDQTFCANNGTLLNGKCLCMPLLYGSCCQYNRKWKIPFVFTLISCRSISLKFWVLASTDSDIWDGK